MLLTPFSLLVSSQEGSCGYPLTASARVGVRVRVRLRGWGCFWTKQWVLPPDITGVPPPRQDIFMILVGPLFGPVTAVYLSKEL